MATKAKYIDVYLLPIPKKNLAKYRAMAKMAGRIFRKHGALSYREYIFSDKTDVKAFGIVPFSQNLKLKKGEIAVYAAVEFKSEAHRNKTMKKVFTDPTMAPPKDHKPIFDMKRMVYGGYKIFVEI